MHAPRRDAARSFAHRFALFLATALTATGLTTLATVVHGAVVAPPVAAATYLGSAARMTLYRPIVDMAATPTAKGYWLVASDGGIFSFGDAHFYGSTGGKRLAQPIVGMTATPTGRGYWLVASDGGIFSFGDARFHGSTGGMRLVKPVVGMARSMTGRGYWMVASDGGIFSFGDAGFHGSAGGRHLVEPIVGMSAARTGGGYWLVARDGGVFAYGARFYGSAAGAMAGQPAVHIVTSPKNDGYWIASQWGGVFAASSGGVRADPNLQPRTGEAAIASELVKRINTERAARGLRMLFIDPLLQSSASAWAHYLVTTGQFAHQDLGKLIRTSGGRFAEVGENLFGGGGRGATDAGTAHLTLMHSDEHRGNILLPEGRLVGVGAACLNGTLIVVEDFATPFGIPLTPHPVPPLNPIASGSDGGASC